MGQQQLLLIMVGLIIVAIAVLVGISMFQDNAVDHNRAVVIADLKTLASKAQHYYSKPAVIGGGGRSFAGLSVDDGISILAGPSFTDNANGTYTILPPGGTSTELIIHGVGKVSMSDGTFPAYDVTVGNLVQELTRLN